MPAPFPQRLLAYCRPGFEGECAQELAALDARLSGTGYARAARGSGYVEFVSDDAAGLAGRWRDLVFARQLLVVLGDARGLPPRDRLSVLLPIAEGDDAAAGRRRWCDAWVEAPDSDAARELAPLCRGLEAALVAALKQRQLIDRDARSRLHVCMTATDAAFVAAADRSTTAPWRGGIPRLKFPRNAPSRSTLKLEEALLVLLDDGERERWLKPGMRAVDLGASPGGWTWQLVARSLHVTAVDNGPMDAALIASGLVDHLRADGFRYRPPRAVDWLVCDMVEQPRRVAELIAHWLSEGLCRHAIFNLKLP
ncbi:23S rRNA (cytidine(2498)-2'-O)-methyltransferase RlmM, partial [Dokdonella sp.]|uniref:23S rRNA (cytidine(2498)-2'-O)-methyltransferase RlmM n=1 Tax=Dokdonella sp. TaxID=2291710 RepID=UPI002F418933